MPATFGVVDLFAGPGGLGEGFASFTDDGHSPFRIAISIEKEASAHRTLTLRAFLREYKKRNGNLPDQFIDFHAGKISEPIWNEVDSEVCRKATEQVRCLEIGKNAAPEIDDIIKRLRRNSDFEDTILIGGPPCQAYSLVGRARLKGKIGYVPESDPRHYLFQEYIRVLEKLRPAAFVMENVKGMLSSTLGNRQVFDMLLKDLSSLGTGRGHHYELYAIKVEDGTASLKKIQKQSDFIVHSEDFGIPQRRHRVIIIGIRSNLKVDTSKARIKISCEKRSVSNVIENLPPLRSGLSRGNDSHEEWKKSVISAAKTLAALEKGVLRKAFHKLARDLIAHAPMSRSSTKMPKGYGRSNDDLLSWLECSKLSAVAQHETRGHMASDLGRYMYAAVFGREYEYSPKASDFPDKLSPAHRNWNSGKFNDRFRVQLAKKPSTTITSHISKDGHYFIHPDPMQCRSLTVREAARLQTFPDDYLFLGNRTQQYVQVGNAVPPYLARQIALCLLQVLNPSKSPRPIAGA